MRIYCPKCKVGYEVDMDLIPQEGKKLRCSYCAHVFTAHQEDLIEIPLFEQLSSDEGKPGSVEDKKAELEKEPQPAGKAETPSEGVNAAETPNSNDDALGNEESTVVEAVSVPENTDGGEIKEIFERLSIQTETLFREEQKLPLYKRVILKIRQLLGLSKKSNRFFTGIMLIALFLLLMYGYRFDLVRSMPFLNPIFKSLGIYAKVPGEGLVFQNIVWNDFEDDYVRTLEVKGFITNNTARDINIPLTKVELLDKNALSVQTILQKPSVKTLKPGGRVAISILIKKPSPQTKYIFLTFVDEAN